MKTEIQHNFLKELAVHILEDYGNDFSRLKVVLPSKRSVVFFRYFLSQTIEKSSWSPDIITISEWVSELTSHEEIDKTTLLFELFKVVKKYLKKDAPISEFYYHFKDLKFDNFYPFGETLLSDFNEMDAYNVNHKDLFRILKEHAELESVFDYLTTEQVEAIQYFWKGFSNENLSKEQQGFIELWKFLPGLYEVFSTHLIKSNKVYGGLNYKIAVQGISDGTIKYDTDFDYIFAGFNALNTCEVALLNGLQKKANVSFYWDADDMYIKKEEHEAGYFIRNLVKQFPDKRYGTSFPSKIYTKDKKPFVHLIATSSIELQAKAISNMIRQHPDMQNKVSTAIVLSDESFLFPILYSLPDSINHLNVTMGYPITDSSLYSFVDSYFSMYNSLESESLKGYKTSDILKLLRNPFLLKCFDINENIRSIKSDKKRTIKPDEISSSIQNDLLKSLFKPINTGNELISNLSIFLSTILSSDDQLINKLTDFEKEFFYYIYTHINQISALLLTVKEQINLRSAYRIVQKGLQSLRVPFTGEPISGMQVMGVLETRALDFENLFIIGLNEGIWPKISTSATLIPESIRRGFGLTTIQHQDSIYAYYFYRLLQRSKNTYLYYNNIIGDGKGKEKSRFIIQLKELYPDIIASDTTIVLPLYNTTEQDISIERTPEIQEKLQEYGANRVSASAINQYLSCSLKFYFKNILKLKEKPSDFDKIGPREIGNLLHNAMEYIYEPYEGKVLRKKDFISIKKSVSTHIQTAFNYEFLKTKTKKYELNGEDKIIEHLVLKYIDKVLIHDESRVPFRIIKTEAECNRSLIVHDGKKEIAVNIKGYIDRVDEKEGNYYLVDYKTGSDLESVNYLDQLFDRDFSISEKKPKAILQMMLYAYIFMSEYPTKNITPLLYTIKSLHSDSISIGKEQIKFTPDDKNGLMNTYLEALKKLLTEMLFSLTPFTKTNNKNQCKYCPYINICGR